MRSPLAPGDLRTWYTAMWLQNYIALIWITSVVIVSSVGVSVTHLGPTRTLAFLGDFNVLNIARLDHAVLPNE